QVHTSYRDHHAWSQHWSRRRSGNVGDAADSAHDTFARILDSRSPAVSHEPRAYLTTVARGISVNWYQRRASEQAYSEASARVPEDEAPSPERQLIISQTSHEIDAMSDASPAPVRRAFSSSQIEGSTYEAIAREIGVSL
ncbi:hypothetical protein OY671_012454, partial [Metschnikowia pulcherrima]